MSRPFTPEEDRVILREWPRGTLSKQIGRNMDPPRDHRSVVGRAHKLGLPKRRRSPSPGQPAEWSGVTVSIPNAVLQAARARCAALGIPVTRLVVNLLKRELGL